MIDALIGRLFLGVGVTREVAVDDVDVLAAIWLGEEAGYEMVAQEAAATCNKDCAEEGRRGWGVGAFQQGHDRLGL